MIDDLIKNADDNSGRHVVILGAGASIASDRHNSEKNGRILPGMNNLIDVVGLKDLVKQLPTKYHSETNIESLYSKVHDNKNFISIVKEIEQRIYEYFDLLELPDSPTIYDYLVLSLRKKDVIATFNWDPFLYQAYYRNSKFTTDLPEILFLHGNVSVGYNINPPIVGIKHNISNNGHVLLPMPLLYPIKNKKYNNRQQ